MSRSNDENISAYLTIRVKFESIIDQESLNNDFNGDLFSCVKRILHEEGLVGCAELERYDLIKVDRI